MSSTEVGPVAPLASPSPSRNVPRTPLLAGALAAVAVAVFVPVALLAGDGRLMPGDARMAGAVNGFDWLPVDSLMAVFTVAGGGTGLLVLLALVLLLLVTRRAYALAVFAAAGVLGAIALDRGLKDAFGRPRPGLADALDRSFLGVGRREVIATVVVLVVIALLTRRRRDAVVYAVLFAGVLGLSFLVERAISPPAGLDSFPSGHATGAAALATVVAVLVWRTPYRGGAVALGIGFAFLVGLSRVYFGVHYPSDVLAGWAVGVAWVSCLVLLALLAGRLDSVISAHPFWKEPRHRGRLSGSARATPDEKRELRCSPPPSSRSHWRFPTTASATEGGLPSASSGPVGSRTGHERE